MTRRGRGRPPYPDILTPAEWRILDEVRTGATNAEIAVRLGLSPYTVKYHISNILGKLELRNRREIAVWRPRPARVRIPELAGARLRALFGPLAVPFAFLSKPVVGFAVAAAVALVAIPAIILAVLLTRPSEPVNLLISPAPTASPAAQATPATTPTATPTPDPTPAPTPEATPEPPPEPEPEPTPEPTPEPEPSPAATPNALGIREIPIEDAFVRLQYAPGEQIAEHTGVFFLDIETGAVEGWQSVDGLPLAASPNSRYVAVGGALHDREADRTFAWDPAALRRAAWGGGAIAFERPGGEEGSETRYVLVGPSMEAETEFELPQSWGIELSALDLGRLIARDRETGELHIVDTSSGARVASGLVAGSGELYRMDDGFALVSTAEPGSGEVKTLASRLLRVGWSGELLSDATVEYVVAGEYYRAPKRSETGVRLSPDGRLIAVTSRVVGCCEEYSIRALATVSIIDATSGEELLQVRGATFPSRDVDDPGVWLANSSGVVVGTVLGNQIVTANGEWLPVSSRLTGGRLFPAPDDPARFLHDMETVVELGGQVIASADFERTRFSSWGGSGRFVRFEPIPMGRGRVPVGPSILPATQQPPFDDSLTAQVTVDSCLNVRSEPTTDSDIEVCLPDQRVVALMPNAELGHLVEGACVDEDVYGCVWVHVLTEDGEQGWAYSDFLRWPGTPLAVAGELLSDEAAEG